MEGFVLQGPKQVETLAPPIGMRGSDSFTQPSPITENLSYSDIVSTIRKLHILERELPGESTRIVFRDFKSMDNEIYEHGYRVALIACLIAQKAGLPPKRIANLALGAWLHDIGKVHIPHEIRNKAGVFTEREYKMMQKHVLFGHAMLKHLGNDLWASIALNHHERHNGTGYPNRAMAFELEVETQIVSIADTYDAITTRRCYRNNGPHERAITEIITYSGTQFNPKLVSALMAIERDVFHLRFSLIDSNEFAADRIAV